MGGVDGWVLMGGLIGVWDDRCEEGLMVWVDWVGGLIGGVEKMCS